jgi:hypothetical protein
VLGFICLKKLDIPCNLFYEYNWCFDLNWISCCDLRINLMIWFKLDLFCDLRKEWIHGMIVIKYLKQKQNILKILLWELSKILLIMGIYFAINLWVRIPILLCFFLLDYIHFNFVYAFDLFIHKNNLSIYGTRLRFD